MGSSKLTPTTLKRLCARTSRWETCLSSRIIWSCPLIASLSRPHHPPVNAKYRQDSLMANALSNPSMRSNIPKSVSMISLCRKWIWSLIKMKVDKDKRHRWDQLLSNAPPLIKVSSTSKEWSSLMIRSWHWPSTISYRAVLRCKERDKAVF